MGWFFPPSEFWWDFLMKGLCWGNILRVLSGAQVSHSLGIFSCFIHQYITDALNARFILGCGNQMLSVSYPTCYLRKLDIKHICQKNTKRLWVLSSLLVHQIWLARLSDLSMVSSIVRILKLFVWRTLIILVLG